MFRQTRTGWPGVLPRLRAEVNPVEGLWADLKGHAIADHTPDSIGELEQHLKGAARGLRRKDRRGVNYIKHAGLLLEDEDAPLCEGQ
jgi:hypothetical protein